MALSQVTVWVPGQVLTAAALNSEFTNILNNPISLISPTTGSINFNLQAHTNMVPSAVTGTSGAVGNTLQTTGGAAFWGSIGSAFTSLTSGQLLVGASSGGFTTLAIGTTGQVLAVTSSNSTPAWQVIPPGGGLSTGAVSTGALYYLSTAGTLVPLTIGTSGQVLTVSTALLPSWAAAAAGGAAGTVRAVTVTVTSGNMALTTAFANLTPGLTITPATTAPRLQIDVTGVAESTTPSNGNMIFTFTLDGANLGGPTQGLWSLYPAFSSSSDTNHSLIVGGWLTSIVSTAAHTINVQALNETPLGAARSILRSTDPPFRLSAVEIVTTG